MAVDSDLKSFVDWVMAWYVDPTHFEVTVSTGNHVIDGGTSNPLDYSTYLAACEAEWGKCVTVYGQLREHYGTSSECVCALISQALFVKYNGVTVPHIVGCAVSVMAFFGVVQQTTTIKSFYGVTEGAVRHVPDFVKIWGAGETEYEVVDLADVLEDVLGVRIGVIFDDRLDEVQQSLFNLYALFGAGGRENVDIPANSVIVTKRRVRALGIEWAIADSHWHTALELPLTETYGILGYNPTIAAYADSNRLVARRNDISEQNNFFIGTVTLEPDNFFSVWVALVESDRNYCNNLYYAYLGTNPNAYNSNGYTAGIIGSIGASTDAPINALYLGNRLVPSSEFEERDCTSL